MSGQKFQEGGQDRINKINRIENQGQRQDDGDIGHQSSFNPENPVNPVCEFSPEIPSQNGNTPRSTAAKVITTDAANKNGAVNF